MIRIFFLSQSSPILELFPFDKITLKSYICTVVTVMAKQCWSQTVLESGSWGHSVLQTPALVYFILIHFSSIAMKASSLLNRSRTLIPGVFTRARESSGFYITATHLHLGGVGQCHLVSTPLIIIR